MESQATFVLQQEQHEEDKENPLGIFEKYLSIWVLLCIIIGVLIGYYIPPVRNALLKTNFAEISLPIAILVWGMILPMMLQIDFTSIKNVWKSWKGIVLTSSVNYLIQPFVMYGLAVLFFNFVFSSLISDTLQLEYIAGSVILGGSPCTAMVFVWSFLLDGDASYTLAQVVVNDLILLVAYIPTIQLLLSLSGVLLPWLTLVFSLVVFVVIPIISGGLLRWYIVSRHGVDYLEHKVMPKMKPLTIIFLLLTLVLIFIFQSDQVVKAPLHILLIAVPLTIQTVFIWAITFAAAYFLKLPFRIAGPASLIASSNFFELAVAVAVSILGADSGATLVTTVGVLTEVPIMLALVYFCNRSKDIFKTQ